MAGDTTGEKVYTWAYDGFVPKSGLVPRNAIKITPRSNPNKSGGMAEVWMAMGEGEDGAMFAVKLLKSEIVQGDGSTIGATHQSHRTARSTVIHRFWQ